jgi:hypothetical protein
MFSDHCLNNYISLGWHCNEGLWDMIFVRFVLLKIKTKAINDNKTEEFSHCLTCTHIGTIEIFALIVINRISESASIRTNKIS